MIEHLNHAKIGLLKATSNLEDVNPKHVRKEFNAINRDIEQRIAMDKKTTVFLAKKLFTELVFNTAYIEGVNVTFPQTQTILDGGIVSQVPVSDIQTVLNLRDAWRYCINNFESTKNYDFLCKINEMVSRNESLAWGSLRTGKVGISGTEYMPEIPREDEVKEQLHKILSISDTVEKALESFCYIVYLQLFWDGNKRTATIFASKILMEAGIGILSIGKSEGEKFNESLLQYYDTVNSKELKECLKTCIISM